MIKLKEIILLFIFIISIANLAITIKFDKNLYKEENKKIIGKIVYIKHASDKTVIDVKEKNKYRITLYKEANYNYGDIVNIEGTFIVANNNTVFNLFNYRKYLLSKKIMMISNNPNIRKLYDNKNIFYALKNKMIKRINNYKSRKYVKTFIMGDTSDIEDDVISNYRNIGISHLLAISGMHLSLFLFMINLLFKNSKLKNLIIFVFLILLLFITNYPESLIRCTLFMILKYINSKFKLNYNNMQLLILCFCILTLYNPYFIYNVGFIFSVVITFFILLSKDLLKGKGYLTKMVISSFICFFASIPVIANTFFKINLLTPLFNIILIPIVSMVIFPFGILVFIFPFLDNLYFIITSGMECIINDLSNINIFNFVISKPNLIITLLYYLVLFLSIKISKKYIFLFIIILIINMNSKLLIMNPKVVFLDVGQGDSSIIILPKGKTVMIDSGGIYNSNYSIVLNKTIPYLNSMGINKVKTLILTHGDYDHIGEANNLVNNFKVDEVIFNCGKYNDLEKELINVLKNKKIKYYACIKELNIDKYKLQFLNAKGYDNENENSNVIYFNYFNYKFLFMGDAGVKREKNILEKYSLEDIDFLKVGHHGSNTSSSEEFINSINSKHSLISVGKNNRYGHPKDSVLDTLSKSKIYRTDLDGSIEIKLNKNGYKIRTSPP